MENVERGLVYIGRENAEENTQPNVRECMAVENPQGMSERLGEDKNERAKARTMGREK